MKVIKKVVTDELLKRSSTSANGDFFPILDRYGLNYVKDEYHWLVGNITRNQGWILHLSAILSEVTDLINAVIPELLLLDTPFKIVRNESVAINLLEGTVGYQNLGKIVTIYPHNDYDAVKLAKKLISIGSGFKGIDIPTDFHLSSNVYTRYGSFLPAIKDEAGIMLKYLRDHKGNLVQDPYSIPFSLPRNVKWPFDSIRNVKQGKSMPLLNNRYYPFRTLKYDSKGNVMKALYFHRYFYIKSCLIKQGKHNMATDDAGRDVKEKLKWQFQVYQKIRDRIPTPEIFDYFEQGSDGYLVMQYITGVSLQKWINSTYDGKCWIKLPMEMKFKIIEVLRKALTICDDLHQLGYVHRDLTPDNFMMASDGRILLIDFELSWSTNAGAPWPPFNLGTFGFMSPEQLNKCRPTIKEDIYTIGCFMFIYFTNLLPINWNQENWVQLKEYLGAFIGEQNIGNMIVNCLHPIASQRPRISDILNDLTDIEVSLKNKNQLISKTGFADGISSERFRYLIESGIAGLANSVPIHTNGFWLSKQPNNSLEINNNQRMLTPLPGWHTGVAGPMWMLARAKAAGFDISSCLNIYERSWEYLQKLYGDFDGKHPSSLFYGTTGVAIAVAKGIENGLIRKDIVSQRFIKNCLYSNINVSKFDNASDFSGQAMAILNCIPYLEDRVGQKALTTHIEVLLRSDTLRGAEGNPFKFYEARSEAIRFLLAIYKKDSNESIRKHLEKILEKLASSVLAKKINLFKLNDYQCTNEIVLGLSEIFIHGFEAFGQIKCKLAFEKIMTSYPKRAFSYDFSLESGQVGLGHLMLDGYRVFKNEELIEQAFHIARTLAFLIQDNNNGGGYWLADKDNLNTADLFLGTSGIIDYLIRFEKSDNLQHPLFAS